MKSYYVEWIGKAGRIYRSLRYGLLIDAEQRLDRIVDIPHETVAHIVESSQPPEIFPHCPDGTSTAIGSRCDVCREIVTEEHARVWKGQK